MSETNRGSLLLSFLYPESMNEIEKIEFSRDLRDLVADTVSKKYPKMRYLLADEDILRKK